MVNSRRVATSASAWPTRTAADQARWQTETGGDAAQGSDKPSAALISPALANSSPWRSTGATFGVLTVNTTLYVGPLADIAGGVDLSTIGSAAIAGLIYLASLSFIEG